MARRIESVTRQVGEALESFYDDAIPRLREIIHGFPEANRSLSFPSMSIDIQAPNFVNQIPWVLSQDPIDPTTKQAVVRYVMGQYNWSIQVDLWERTKEERHDLFEEFYVKSHPELPKTGLVLTLPRYHGVKCNYQLSGVEFEDNEASSQRKEWRARVSMQANCFSVIEKTEYIIETTEVTVETPPVIPEP